MAQTFVPGASGKLSAVDLQLATATTGSTGPIIVEIRNTTASALPGTTVLATTTFDGVGGTNAWNSIAFSTPATVSSGTRYAIVLRAATGGDYRAVRSNNNAYANGVWYTSSNSGGAWSSQTTDLAFRTYVTPVSYASSGNLVSSVKDSNPAIGSETRWTRLSWTADAPANTQVRFQAAGSNSASGPFNFVGPDGTANSFFTTSNASLSQFNGFRYLKYKAYLSTTSTAATPTLNDVNVCNNNNPAAGTIVSVNAGTGTYGGTTALSALLTSGGNPLSGKSISFKLNGNTVGNATTDGAGLASIPNVSLSGINAANYANAVNVTFAGDDDYASNTGSNKQC
jgi:hypothetical protein